MEKRYEITSYFEKRTQQIKEILPVVQDMPIENLELGTHASNALRRGGIHTVGALIQMSKDIFELRNIGALGRNEIATAIESIVQSGKIVFRERVDNPPLDTGSAHENNRIAKIISEVDTILLDDVPFSVRARNALRGANIKTVGALIQRESV